MLVDCIHVWYLGEGLGQQFSDKLKENKAKRKTLNKKITELESERPGLIKMRNKGELTSEEFIEEKNKIVSDIKKYEGYIKNLNSEDEKILDKLSESVELYTELVPVWKTLDDYKKALLILKMTVELKVDNEKELQIEENPIFKALRQLNMSNWSYEPCSRRTFKVENLYEILIENQKNFIDFVRTIKISNS